MGCMVAPLYKAEMPLYWARGSIVYEARRFNCTEPGGSIILAVVPMLDWEVVVVDSKLKISIPLTPDRSESN